jgi:recombination protein RecA
MPTPLKKILDDLKKTYGEGTILDFSKDERIAVETITTGLPSLDFILGGGIPKGRIIEIYGTEGSGKTTMGLTILSKCQEKGKKVCFIDAENSFDPAYAEKIGVNLNNLLLNQPNSGQEALNIVEKLCQSGEVSVIVIDSVANLVPQADLNKEIGDSSNIGSRARMLSELLPRLSTEARKTGTTLVFINQIRFKIGEIYGNPMTTPGGMALKFNASLRVEVHASKEEEQNGKTGVKVTVRVRKNKIARPFRKTELFLELGIGFDVFTDLIETAITAGVIEQKGAWYVYGDLKCQGFEELLAKLTENDKLKKEIEQKLLTIKI